MGTSGPGRLNRTWMARAMPSRCSGLGPASSQPQPQMLRCLVRIAPRVGLLTALGAPRPAASLDRLRRSCVGLAQAALLRPQAAPAAAVLPERRNILHLRRGKSREKSDPAARKLGGPAIGRGPGRGARAGGLSSASFTRSRRPRCSRPSKRRMASAAVVPSENSANAKPRERPVARSMPSRTRTRGSTSHSRVAQLVFGCLEAQDCQ